jgi:hypothetical protein
MSTMDDAVTYQFRNDNDIANSITFCAGSNEEMLKISPTGFWVRGEKIKQDDSEAEIVYNAFKAWLTWQQMNGFK